MSTASWLMSRTTKSPPPPTCSSGRTVHFPFRGFSTAPRKTSSPQPGQWSRMLELPGTEDVPDQADRRALDPVDHPGLVVRVLVDLDDDRVRRSVLGDDVHHHSLRARGQVTLSHVQAIRAQPDAVTGHVVHVLLLVARHPTASPPGKPAPPPSPAAPPRAALAATRTGRP